MESVVIYQDKCDATCAAFLSQDRDAMIEKKILQLKRL
jgi:hypothetical protein